MVDAAADTLEVRFVDGCREIDPGQTLTFGRRADLCLDPDNPLLGAELGRFEHRTGLWWLVNIGRNVWLELHDLDSDSESALAPGRDIALSTPRTSVRFSAGPTNYELEVSLGSG